MKKRVALILSIAMVFSLMLSGLTAGAEAPVTINYVITPGSMDKYLDACAAEYVKQYPNVTFTKTVMEQEQQRSTVPSIMSGPGAPDFAWLNFGSGDCQPLVAMGALENLDKYYEQYKLWDILPEHLNTHRIEGSMYHFSVAFATAPIIYYNKAIFSEVGVEIPGTYDELVAISAKLRQAGYQPLMMGDRDGWPGFHMYEAIATTCMPVENYNAILYFNTQEATMADYPGFAKAFDTMRDMEVNKVWGDGAVAMNDDEAKAVFMDGKAAMYETGPWAIDALRGALGDNLDYFWFPKVDPSLGRVLTVSYPDEFCVSAYAKQEVKDEIARFFAFVLSKEGQRILVKNSTAPIRVDLTKEDLDDIMDPVMVNVVADFSSPENSLTDEIVTFWGNELYAELRQKVQAAVTGELSGAQIVEGFDKLAANIRASK